ncbi:Selenocysteine lyase/Cysteine desulfurase [Algoriphagus faecimaris]|uniref:Selenocysteine lyase/Cysteine desulfurase n=1 Tax=Algoriphagus faecimaris TaxID=686796 RepID=A0A1G6RVN1_9BACT|nr:aminotransferase class V-fold PLP-dependent enzyme [Algoriphagus faecimaris]SDD08740.1 Selenocysteine lyase/Cysteine desulfurase [Algoriphagus faecimaris]
MQNSANNRRDFLQKIVSLSAFLGIPPSAFAKEKAFQKRAVKDVWEEVRQEFPLESTRSYFNNGTFGPSPYVVIAAVKESLDQTNRTGDYGNPSQGRAKIAEFFGVKTSEISLTHNTTEGINIMAWGVPLEKGDEVILTSHEHAGGAIPWLNRARLHGIVLKVIEPKPTQMENVRAVEEAITSKTRVIAIPHVTCTTGLVYPIKEIAALAQKNQIFTAIDGAHGAGTFDLNLADLGVDFYAGCFHKWMCGPNGSGFLYVRQELLDVLQAYHVGAYSDKSWELSSQSVSFGGYVPTAHRYDYGTQSTPIHLGVLAAIDFHQKLGKEKIEKRVRELNSYLMDGLKEIPSLEILTPQESKSRISVATFRFSQVPYTKVSKFLVQRGFRVRGVHEAKLNAIRISTHIYNSKSEIDELLKALGDFAST